MEIDAGDVKIKIEDEDLRLVSGWANVEIVDVEGHIIDALALSKAMIRYMQNGGPIQLGHTSSPVGRVVFWLPKKHPKTGKVGIYIGAVINKNDPLDDEVWRAIKEGKYKGFSIGGYAKSMKDMLVKGDDGTFQNVKYVDDLILKEISIVTKPANPLANIEEVNLIAKGRVDEMPFMRIEKKIESKDDLRRILIGILDEAKKIKGFVDNHAESGAYKGMADDLVKTIAALIDELDSGIIEVKKGIVDPELEWLERKILIQKALIKGEHLELYDVLAKELMGVEFDRLCDILKSEVVGIANELLKESDDKSRYYENGHFKEMTCPDDPSETSRFCGCVRYMMHRGYGLETAKKICAKIKQMKYGG